MFLAVSEDKFLHQIHLEEQFGTAVGPGKHKHHQEIKSSIPKAAIGYTYDDSNPTGNAWSVTGSKGAAGAAGPIDKKKDFNKPKSDSEEDSDEELDFGMPYVNIRFSSNYNVFIFSTVYCIGSKKLPIIFCEY